MVNDEARQGTLRFAESKGGPFLAETGPAPIPPVLNLPQLLFASEQVENNSASGEQLRLLLAPGSSLGGARPKASVRDKGQRLAIAKFPSKNDEIDVVLWEAVALTLAARAGIVVPQWRIEIVSGKPVLLLQRFDRIDMQRIPFLSAMSMLGADDGETRSYLELVDALRQHGAQSAKDIQRLWRRIVFSVLISNTDDHLRNHGFLHAGEEGWTLSPAYDLNPVPIDVKPRVLSTMIDLEDSNASLELAMSVIDYFELDVDNARAIVREVAHAVTTWREVARQRGMSNVQIERMATAFEHPDLTQALAL